MVKITKQWKETSYNMYDKKKEKPYTDHYRQTEWNGYLYEAVKCSWDKRWGFYRRQDTKEDKIPDVLCHCGNTEFELKYGHYEIIAICKNCGRKDVVYDG